MCCFLEYSLFFLSLLPPSSPAIRVGTLTNLFLAGRNPTGVLFKYLFIWLHRLLIAARGILFASFGIFHCDTHVDLTGIKSTNFALQGAFLTTGPPVPSCGSVLFDSLKPDGL